MWLTPVQLSHGFFASQPGTYQIAFGEKAKTPAKSASDGKEGKEKDKEAEKEKAKDKVALCKRQNNGVCPGLEASAGGSGSRARHVSGLKPARCDELMAPRQINTSSGGIRRVRRLGNDDTTFLQPIALSLIKPGDQCSYAAARRSMLTIFMQHLFARFSARVRQRQ